MSARVYRSDSRERVKRQRGTEMPPAALVSACEQARAIPEAVKTLNRQGVGVTDIARAMGVRRWTVWSWRRGRYYPRDPVVTFSLIAWARLVETNGVIEAPKEIADASL